MARTLRPSWVPDIAGSAETGSWSESEDFASSYPYRSVAVRTTDPD
jgi:hypothetical protein